MIKIDGVAIDIATSESYSFESESTSLPVEEGSDESDHVRLPPLEITIECVVSNSPTGRVASDPSRVDANGKASDAVFQRMLAIRDARRPVTYEGRRGRFENMVLSFEVSDDVETAEGLRFTAKLKQVQLVQNRRVTIKRISSVSRGQPKIDKGAVAGLNKLGGLKAILVFTIKPGQKVDPTAWWANDPNKTLIFTSPAGRHYRAENGALADGYVDAGGYHPLKQKLPTSITMEYQVDADGHALPTVTSDGTPIPQTTDYVSPLEQRIGPRPVESYQDAFNSGVTQGVFNPVLGK